MQPALFLWASSRLWSTQLDGVGGGSGSVEERASGDTEVGGPKSIPIGGPVPAAARHAQRARAPIPVRNRDTGHRHLKWISVTAPG
jgi:hypothetical protein